MWDTVTYCDRCYSSVPNTVRKRKDATDSWKWKLKTVYCNVKLNHWVLESSWELQLLPVYYDGSFWVFDCYWAGWLYTVIVIFLYTLVMQLHLLYRWHGHCPRELNKIKNQRALVIHIFKNLWLKEDTYEFSERARQLCPVIGPLMYQNKIWFEAAINNSRCSVRCSHPKQVYDLL